MPDNIESPVTIPTVAGTPFGGGIYAGRFAIGAQVYGLVIAPADLGELVETKWGAAKNVDGALSYNDGYTNTEAMAAAGSALGKWARGLQIAGHDDWYLPSRLEALIAFGEVREAAGFARDWYWTSTQSAGHAGYAWYQYFYTGTQTSSNKSAELRARAVRRFPIQ